MLFNFKSSTQAIPEIGHVPRHIAVIMDGNGRWAKKRLLPRIAGHRQGVEAVRGLVKCAQSAGVEFLTLFAFSSENWRRPSDEVNFLMGLFLEALRREVVKLHENNIRFVLIGDRTAFDTTLNQAILAAEELTENNTGLVLTIAANYGGRWDILNAFNSLLAQHAGQQITFSEEMLTPFLSMHYAPEPDLFIRTGGETRISNFLLWQLAYTELYFTETLWPDFDETEFGKALESFRQRERRFGRTSEQLKRHV